MEGHKYRGSCNRNKVFAYSSIYSLKDLEIRGITVAFFRNGKKMPLTSVHVRAPSTFCPASSSGQALKTRGSNLIELGYALDTGQKWRDQ
jgi:hypothetical protein